MKLKIFIQDRGYSQWDLYDSDTSQPVDNHKTLEPCKEKLFTGDIFEINNNICKIIHSTVRVEGSYSGILVLDGGQTYGRCKKKLLYKCIPDDMRLPIFLVPYEGKKKFFQKTYK